MNLKKRIGILGGGIAGLSLAYFLKDTEVAIIERESKVGGLCRSYQKRGLSYDVGPHIMFSKNSEVLRFMTTITKTHKLTRSNQIFLGGKFIKYPFENFLAMLDDKIKIDYCLNTFLNNPYKDMPATNMLSFFLKNFGEGITKLYLEPYNEKIWKFSPAMLDTQMVERIPRPPDEHITESAKGKFSEGYTHQLNFFYPVKGGYQSMIDGVLEKITNKGVQVLTDEKITSVTFQNNRWVVQTQKNHFEFEKLINCMPIQELVAVLQDVPDSIKKKSQEMMYNSIAIIIINVKNDTIGDHFALMVPQSDVLFHRISKLDFLGDNYHLKNSTSFLVEVTFRKKSKIAQMSEAEITERCIEDLVKIGFIKNKSQVNFTDFHAEEYAYVIYDLNHRARTDTILEYFRGLNIESSGRWAEFEYMNSDKVIEHSMLLAQKLND